MSNKNAEEAIRNYAKAHAVRAESGEAEPTKSLYDVYAARKEADKRISSIPSGKGLVVAGALLMMFGIISVARGGSITAFDVIEVLIMLLCGAVYISAGRIVQAVNGNADRIVKALEKS